MQIILRFEILGTMTRVRSRGKLIAEVNRPDQGECTVRPVAGRDLTDAELNTIAKSMHPRPVTLGQPLPKGKPRRKGDSIDWCERLYALADSRS
jgi:hypothetical protein